MMKRFLAILTFVTVLTGALFVPVTALAATDTINPNGSNDNVAESAKLPSGFKSYTKLKKKTKLEKKAYNNCKIINNYAKKYGWKTRGFKRISSSKTKVVTEVFLSGKPRSGEGNFWTFRFRLVQHKTKGVYCSQDGKVVSTDGVLGTIKDPQKYYKK